MSRDRSPRRWGAGFDAKSATSASLYRVKPSGRGHVTGYVGTWRCIQGRFKNMFSFSSRVLRKRNWHLAGAATEWRKKEKSEIVPSTHDGAALVVPATCPGKQEHFTVCDRSSILFLLQQRCSATTSQVPVRTWCVAAETRDGSQPC